MLSEVYQMLQRNRSGGFLELIKSSELLPDVSQYLQDAEPYLCELLNRFVSKKRFAKQGRSNWTHAVDRVYQAERSTCSVM